MIYSGSKHDILMNCSDNINRAVCTGIMSSHGSPVKVYIRIRPTASFAHELINCLPDQQVNYAICHHLSCLNTLPHGELELI